MWKVPLETQQSEAVANNILSQTYKLELAQFLYAALFNPTTASLLISIKQAFLKIWPRLSEKLIKRHIEKSRNIKMGHLHMIRQGLQPTKEKPSDIDLEDKNKRNLVFFTTADPITMKEEENYSDLRIFFPHHINQGKQIHLRNIFI